MPLSNVIVEPYLLRELAGSIYSLITRGAPLSWSAEPKPEGLVQYGVARFIDTNKGDIRVEEPLALTGILRHLEEVSHTIEHDMKGHFQVNRGLWPEEAVLLTVTRLLEKPATLSNIFEFHGEIPEWAHSSVRIVTRLPHAAPTPFSISAPFDPTLIAACSAKDPGAVAHWLGEGQGAWCIPAEGMGPDLIARLELAGGKQLVLFIQAKCHTFGNIETTTAAVTAKAIKSLIPSTWYSSSVRCRLISSYIFIDFLACRSPAIAVQKRRRWLRNGPMLCERLGDDHKQQRQLQQ